MTASAQVIHEPAQMSSGCARVLAPGASIWDPVPTGGLNMRVRHFILLSTVAATAAACAAVLRQPSVSSQAASDAVVATIPVGQGPTLLALSPDGARLFAAANAKLSVIDTASNTIV